MGEVIVNVINPGRLDLAHCSHCLLQVVELLPTDPEWLKG